MSEAAPFNAGDEVRYTITGDDTVYTVVSCEARAKHNFPNVVRWWVDAHAPAGATESRRVYGLAQHFQKVNS